jgi:VWFA-related protein
MTRMTRPLLAVLILVTALAARPGAGQAPSAEQQPDSGQPAVTFSLEVNYVEVDAAVFTRDGTFVADLEENDFQIFEDGVRQDISAFTRVNIPIERAERPLFASRPVEPDVTSNARPFEGRVYVLVLDDLQTAAFRTGQVKKAAREFVERHMAANDVAAVIHTSGRGDAGQEFTSNKRLLLAAIDRFMGRKLRSTTLERLDEYQRQRAIPREGDAKRVQDPLDMQRGFDARSSLESLKAISDFVGNIRGRRKAIIYLG